MRKILIILSLIFTFNCPAEGTEVVPLLEKTPETVYEPVLLESAQESINIYPNKELLNMDIDRHHTKFYDEISKTVQGSYALHIENTKIPSCLLEEPLSWDFESGPVEKLHLWGVLQTNMDMDFEEGEDTDTKFRAGLINILIDGTFKGGKDDFRLILDPTPQSVRPYMQSFVKDAYVQTRRIPNHTVLFGHSRPAIGVEGTQSPYTLPLLNRSQISRHFSNVRKVGVRVKGDYSLVDYDFGGYSSDTFFSSFMPGAEFNGWVNLKPLGKTDGKYGKLVTGGGISVGERHDVDYLVSGAYVGYEYKKFWARAEYANADGSNGYTGLTSKHRAGWYASMGYRLTKKLEMVAKYDEFDPDKNVSKNNKREYTAGMNYYIKGQALKLVLNYVFCQNQMYNNTHRLLLGTQLAL